MRRLAVAPFGSRVVRHVRRSAGAPSPLRLPIHDSLGEQKPLPEFLYVRIRAIA